MKGDKMEELKKQLRLKPEEYVKTGAGFIDVVGNLDKQIDKIFETLLTSSEMPEGLIEEVSNNAVTDWLKSGNFPKNEYEFNLNREKVIYKAIWSAATNIQKAKQQAELEQAVKSERERILRELAGLSFSHNRIGRQRIDNFIKAMGGSGGWVIPGERTKEKV